jgi:hypothetical protein
VTFDQREALFMKTSIENGSTFYYMTDAEYARWQDATKGVVQQWIDAVNKKGADGKALLSAAKELLKQ